MKHCPTCTCSAHASKARVFTAADVKEIARNAPAKYRFGDNKVFIAWLLDHGVTAGELTEMNRLGQLSLSRLDMVEMVDQKIIAASEIRNGRAEFHLLRMDR